MEDSSETHDDEEEDEGMARRLHRSASFALLAPHHHDPSSHRHFATYDDVDTHLFVAAGVVRLCRRVVEMRVGAWRVESATVVLGLTMSLAAHPHHHRSQLTHRHHRISASVMTDVDVSLPANQHPSPQLQQPAHSSWRWLTSLHYRYWNGRMRNRR